MSTKSRTDKLEPSFVIPYMEHEEPKRPKLRKESVLPRCRKSNTDTADPNLEKPKTVTAEPNLENDRRDNPLPR
jgi:hypothetical protein